LSIFACNKPDQGIKKYFEMYKQEKIGISVSKICLGAACISNNGFARSGNYPLCIEGLGNFSVNTTNSTNNTTQTNTTNQTNNTNHTSSTLSIAQWYPQGNNYIFICNAQGFIPTSYDWTFGDGQQLLDYSQNNVYHTYLPGNYAVLCFAKNGLQKANASMQINVG